MSRPKIRTAALTIAMAILVAGVVRAQSAAGSVAARAPERLSETGLYSDIATGRIASRNLPFEPQYPLWTDGAEKSRWIRLPEGKTINATDSDFWVFPVGTRLWKEFAFGGQKVETRLLWRATPREWVFAAYVWNADQTEAFLAPEVGIRNHAEIVSGARHSIPSQADCRSCHESGGTPVLGFNALQLSDDRDPLAPHARALGPASLTISRLERFGLLHPRRPDLVKNPPRIRAGSPRERAVLGYLSANCGSCHNERGPLAGLGLYLQHTDFASAYPAESGIATAVGVPGEYVVPGARPESSRRIAPGSPGASAIVYRMGSRRPSSQMPPLGTAVVDEEALELVRAWIAEDLRAQR
ncbi:MAG: hypothetical protein ACSLFQ_14980 [Thermoanaerobaculia bacterium]